MEIRVDIRASKYYLQIVKDPYLKVQRKPTSFEVHYLTENNTDVGMKRFSSPELLEILHKTFSPDSFYPIEFVLAVIEKYSGSGATRWLKHIDLYSEVDSLKILYMQVKTT